MKARCILLAPKKRPAHPQAGFSLLELLVAITIMGFVGSAMAAGLRLGTNIWQTSTAQNQALYDSGALNQSLRPLLAQADARLFKVAGDISPVFHGTRQTLSFLSRPPQAIRSGGEQLFTVLQTGDALSVHMTPFDPENPIDLASFTPPQPAEPAHLMRDVANVQIRYFGQPRGSAAAYWSDAWTDQVALPNLVEITLRPAKKARWKLPPIVFALETAA